MPTMIERLREAKIALIRVDVLSPGAQDYFTAVAIRTAKPRHEYFVCDGPTPNDAVEAILKEAEA